MQTNPPTLERELEDLIDARGLEAVLLAIRVVCDEKADHIRTNWQDVPTARVWELASSKLYPAIQNAQWEVVLHKR